MEMSRRDFLKAALLAAVAATVPLEAAQKLVEKAEITDDYAFLKAGDYVEITFFGTGLSIITNKLQEDKRVSLQIDGLPFDGELKKPGILAARNYSDTQIHPMVSGLPLGIHTARIAVKEDIKVHGYEMACTNGIERVMNKEQDYRQEDPLGAVIRKVKV